MLDHASSGSDRSHSKSVLITEGFHLIDLDGIRTREKQFNVVETSGRRFRELLHEVARDYGESRSDQGARLSH